MFVYPGRDHCRCSLTGIPAQHRRQSQEDFDAGEMQRLFQLGERMGRRGGHWVHAPWEEMRLSAEDVSGSTGH